MFPKRFWKYSVILSRENLFKPSSHVFQVLIHCASVEADKVKIEFSSKRNSSIEPAGWDVLFGDNMQVYTNLESTNGRHSSSEMGNMPTTESDALTAERLAGTVVHGMYQHFIQLKNRLFLVNHRNLIFEIDPKIRTKFVEIESGNKTWHEKSFYILRDRLICTIIHDNSKYVCLVHDLTDHGASKKDRRRRVLKFILEVWSLDENSNPVFHDQKFLDEHFEDADINVNQIWPYLEPVDDSFTFENAWKQDIVDKYVFGDDVVKGFDGKSYTSNLSGKKLSDLVGTSWDTGLFLLIRTLCTRYFS